MPQRGEITADASLAQAKKTSPAFKSLLQSAHGHHTSSIREDHYKGHHIVIRTTYEIDVDGRPFHGHLDVSNAGTVQYHGIPNVSSNSAIELIRSVIDAFPDEFAAPPEGGHPHGDHGSAGARVSARGRPKGRGVKSTTAAAKRGRGARPRTAAGKEKRHARSRKHSH